MSFGHLRYLVFFAERSLVGLSRLITLSHNHSSNILISSEFEGLLDARFR
jgi:hypothetical protein